METQWDTPVLIHGSAEADLRGTAAWQISGCALLRSSCPLWREVSWRSTSGLGRCRRARVPSQHSYWLGDASQFADCNGAKQPGDESVGRADGAAFFQGRGFGRAAGRGDFESRGGGDPVLRSLSFVFDARVRADASGGGVVGARRNRTGTNGPMSARKNLVSAGTHALGGRLPIGRRLRTCPT